MSGNICKFPWCSVSFIPYLAMCQMHKIPCIAGVSKIMGFDVKCKCIAHKLHQNDYCRKFPFFLLLTYSVHGYTQYIRRMGLLKNLFFKEFIRVFFPHCRDCAEEKQTPIIVNEIWLNFACF